MLTVFLHINCGQKPTTNLISKKQVADSAGTIYEFDTTKYTRHKSGFYMSGAGDIFQLNRVAYDDSTGFWSDHYWLDSLMFYGEYPNQRPLKGIIDLESFVSDTVSRFEKDKKYVYYARATSDGVYRFIVDKADPKTFQSLGDRYGKDKSAVFYESKIVKDADLKTFKVLYDQDSAKDKRHKYYLGDIVE
ncbi:MAG: DKNYY domain-containing protein [Chitinophagaceae bacterium]|nr:DKNYY domain-containing protein [Chitinophagaceae bacterium]